MDFLNSFIWLLFSDNRGSGTSEDFNAGQFRLTEIAMSREYKVVKCRFVCEYHMRI